MLRTIIRQFNCNYQIRKMGGNAMKKVETSRMSLKRFRKIKKDLEAKLSPFLDIHFTLDLPEKTSFGDVDVLYCLQPSVSADPTVTKALQKGKITPLITEIFNPAEMVDNADIVSFAYKYIATEDDTTDNYYEPYPMVGDVSYHQVDLIKCNSPADRELLDFYFSYGDVGGLLGRMVNYYGLKLGHKGLYMNVLNETLQEFQRESHNITDVELQEEGVFIKTTNAEIVILCTDVKEICEYLTLDHNKWRNGFANNIEIFEWLKQCKYFSTDVFSHLNHDHRKRTAVRPFYKSFLEYNGLWLDEQHKFTNAIPSAATTSSSDTSMDSTKPQPQPHKHIHVRTNKDEHRSECQHNIQLEVVRDFGKIHFLEEIITKRRLHVERTGKFNGRILMTDFGVTQREVGGVLQRFKEYVVSLHELSVTVDVAKLTLSSSDKDSAVVGVSMSVESAADLEPVTAVTVSVWEAWLDSKTKEEVLDEVRRFLNKS